MKLIKSLWALPLFSLIVVACGPSSVRWNELQGPTTSIINGTPVRKSERIYKMTARVLILRQDIWYPVCTASIIADDLILTAAHCLNWSNSDEVRVAFDAQPLSFSMQNNPKSRVDVLAKFQTVAVEEFVIHPLYEKSEYNHDMALLKLKGTIPKGFFSVPLLPQADLEMLSPKRKYQVTLAGFGMIDEDPQTESKILRKTKVSARFNELLFVTDQTEGTGGCHGDSGGPAYFEIKGRLFLVGVTHGPKVENPDCHHEGVWGNPSYERAFLNESAQKVGSSARF
jgi:secreted trypsin-like serine protease